MILLYREDKRYTPPYHIGHLLQGGHFYCMEWGDCFAGEDLRIMRQEGAARPAM